MPRAAAGCPTVGEFVEDLPQLGLGADEIRAVQPLAVAIQRDGVVAQVPTSVIVMQRTAPVKFLIVHSRGLRSPGLA
ncbi:hypothetical protein [Actinoplanes sp. URMC 104]|uniref:hypothetical protein n=1 Tax=Actinoplanes sp. URMC 104 TaxID=3423409 RepID=UPI003F1BB8A8